MSTFEEAWYRGTYINVWCTDCNPHRCVRFDIKAWIDAGHGQETMIRRTWRCTKCGSRNGQPKSGCEWTGPDLLDWLKVHRPRS